jgi:hypothetical protein
VPKRSIWADHEGGTVLPAVAAELVRRNEAGETDEAIGRALEVSTKVVQRARKSLGLGKPRVRPEGVREGLLTVEMDKTQLGEVKSHAKAAGYATAAPWARRMLLEVPLLARAAREGKPGAVEQLLEIAAGKAPPE